MKFTLVFVSPNGTTRKTTEELKKILLENNHKVEIIDIGTTEYRENCHIIFEKLKSTDVVGFGSPVYHMGMLEPINELLNSMLESKIEFKLKTFMYLNYAGITTGKAFINTAEILNKMNIGVIGGMKITAPHFHHMEKFPNDNKVETIREFYNKIQLKNFSEIELTRVKKIFTPEKKLVNIIYPFVHFIGKRRELPIEINSEKCKKCKICIKQCPKGAMKLDEKVSIDFDLCIHCYHCVTACPFKAVESPIEKLDGMINMNKKIIGMEYPLNNIYV